MVRFSLDINLQPFCELVCASATISLSLSLSLSNNIAGSLNKVFMFDKVSLSTKCIFSWLLKCNKTKSWKNLDTDLVYDVCHYRAAHFFASLDFPMQSMKMIPPELLRLLERSSIISEIWTCSESPSFAYSHMSELSGTGITTGINLFYHRQYSIGVTTGVAFCGVVGHPLRHEYTGSYSLFA